MEFKCHLGKQNLTRIKIGIFSLVFVVGLSAFAYQQLNPVILKIRRVSRANLRLKRKIQSLKHEFVQKKIEQKKEYQQLLKLQGDLGSRVLNSGNIQSFLHAWLAVFRRNHLKVLAFKPQQGKQQLNLSVQLQGNAPEVLGLINSLRQQALIVSISDLTVMGLHQLYLTFNLTLPVFKWGQFEVEEMTLNVIKKTPFSFQHQFTELKLPNLVLQKHFGWLKFGDQKWDLVLQGESYRWNLVGGRNE